MDQGTLWVILIVIGAALASAVIGAGAVTLAERRRLHRAVAVVDGIQRLIAQAHAHVASRSDVDPDPLGTARQLTAIYLLGRFGRAHRWLRPAIRTALGPLCDPAALAVRPVVVHAARQVCASFERGRGRRGRAIELASGAASGAVRPASPTGRSGRHRI